MNTQYPCQESLAIGQLKIVKSGSDAGKLDGTYRICEVDLTVRIRLAGRGGP